MHKHYLLRDKVPENTAKAEGSKILKVRARSNKETVFITLSSTVYSPSVMKIWILGLQFSIITC
jgi:hypothetical protein